MSIENNKIFEEFWRNFEWPEPAKPLEYRLYYDSTTGDPLFYSTDEFDKPYIVLTQQVYNKYDHNVFVKDEKLHYRNMQTHTLKVVPDPHGHWHSHPTHVEILVPITDEGKKWNLKQLT